MARAASAPKKEISMEEALWKSADKLRGSVEPAEYKHVVLSLFFLKFASDKFEAQRKAISEKYGEKFVDNVAFYTKDNVFFLPEISRWSFIMENAKQDDMRHEYQVKYPDVANKIKFFIGDVRDLQSCRNAMPGVDYIFHAAALKQVPSCEFFPMEAVKTNVIGTDNVLTAAIEAGVGSVICLSTDKAAYPINAMGITKAIEEKIAVAKSRYSGKTKICCTRYGNVMCSRGSVIPLWIDQIRNGNPITLTEPKMTRFIMSLEEAVDLVLFAFEHGRNGDILVQKAPACTIQTQAEAVCELFGGKKEEIKVIGIRHGEKMYETLLTNEECAKAEDMGNFYRVPADNRSLNYDKYFTEGNQKRDVLTEFNSDNTRRLNLEETKAKIAALDYIKKELSGEGNFVQ